MKITLLPISILICVSAFACGKSESLCYQDNTLLGYVIYQTIKDPISKMCQPTISKNDFVAQCQHQYPQSNRGIYVAYESDESDHAAGAVDITEHVSFSQ